MKMKMNMSSSVVALLLVVCTFLSLVLPHNAASPQPSCYARIYNLGDSISDTGNLIHETPAGAFTPFARLPYGLSFPGGPTGRCSDGRLMIDYIAESLGLPLLTPYLKRDPSDRLVHGANFAVAGSTALDTPTLLHNHVLSPVTNSSLTVQLNWFKTHLRNTCNTPHCYQHLADALFMVGEIGGNDYNYALLQGKSIDEVKALVPHVVSTVKEVATELIELGARRLVVPGNFPIGCMPIYLTAFKTTANPAAYNKMGCLNDLNAFARYHNLYLQKTLDLLRMQHPDVTILYADYYNALEFVLYAAPKLGFEKSSILKACCGTGGEYNFNLTKMCGMEGASACPNPSKYVNWDGIHMTQEAYRHMATWLLEKLQLKTHC